MVGGLAQWAPWRTLGAGLLAAGFMALSGSAASATAAPGVASLSVVGFKSGESQDSVLTSLAAAGHGSVSAAGNSAAGGQAFKSSRVVNLAAPGRPTPSSSPSLSAARASVGQPRSNATSKSGSEGPLGVEWLLWAALLSVFVGLLGAVVALVAPPYVSHRQRRLDSIEGYVRATPPREGDQSTVATISASLVHMGDKVMDGRKSTPRTQLLLDRADLPLRLGEWAVLRAVAVVVGVAGGIILLHGGSTSMFIGSCLGGLLGVVLPVLFLKFSASRRANLFEAQLPDVLTLVASSLSTGFSLLQALDAVARDAADPSAKEFSRALAETRIGAELNESLAHLADRMDSTNLRWTAMAIDIQRQVGGNLGETLRNTAATLRDRQSLARHVKALAAEGKLSAYILIVLPIGIFFYMTVVNRPYVALLWSTMIGIGMLVGAVISMSFGVFWMSKVVKVEV